MAEDGTDPIVAQAPSAHELRAIFRHAVHGGAISRAALQAAKPHKRNGAWQDHRHPVERHPIAAETPPRKDKTKDDSWLP